MSCATAAAATTSTSTCTTTTSTCNPTKFINSSFSLHSNSIRRITHFVKVPTWGLFKKKHAMRIPKRSIASCFSLFSPLELNFSFFSPHSFLDYPSNFSQFASRRRAVCACEGCFLTLFFLESLDYIFLFQVIWSVFMWLFWWF